MAGTQLLGELERVRVAVDHDDRGGGERGETLDADVAEPAGADQHTGGAGVEQGDRLAHGVVGRDAGVGERRDILRPGCRVEPHTGPCRGEQVLRHSAIATEAGERAAAAMHVLPCPAGPAQPAGGRGMQNHRVADPHVADRGADLVHPAGVLVADRVRQRDAHRLCPLALDDVQIGAAHAGAADLHDHVERIGDRRLRHLLDDGLLMVSVQPNGLHRSSSPSPLVSYRCRNMPRQMSALAWMLMRVVRARRRCSGTRVRGDRRAGARFDQQRRVVAGRQAEFDSALPQPIEFPRRQAARRAST